MNNAANINNIIHEIETLDYSGKINIMSKIIAMLKHSTTKQTSTKITRMKGLGKKVWQDVDVDNYIANERESWD
jgi:hypothetical protein